MPTVSRGLYKWLLWRGATLEDFADRLNHFWTFGLLLILACIISWKQGYNSPISCWVPAQFTDSFTSYTHQHCWNSYFIQYPRDIEKAEKEILEMEMNISLPDISFVTYEPKAVSVNSESLDETDSLLKIMSTTRTLYQWVPLILCFQALLFKLPNLLMYILHSLSGISFDKIAGLTSGYENINLKERDDLSKKIGRYMFNWCQQFENWLPWRFLTLLWLIVKFLYCVNIIVQMSLIDAFLRTTDSPIDNSTSYGDVITGNLFQNNATTWKESPAFPRQILCDFSIRQLQNIQRWTVQCDLPVNYFNEYVYMFIWVWFLFVAIVTCLSLLLWLCKTMVPLFRKRYITNAMGLADDLDIRTMQYHDLGKFCNLIGEDGVMALKLAGANSSELLVSDVVYTMWKLCTKDSRPQQAGQILSVPEVRVQPATTAGPGNVTYPRLEGQEFDNEAKKID
ncbi:innexin unc-9-like [Mercenaria mercenaria]|uniref:innexin unc-9-like n=1 Tax=Mercenaria mercenaria TaxID=6596 RepID=UPI00234E8C8E|nr:innexin unc-9-like [Mercenaria mercenaria]